MERLWLWQRSPHADDTRRQTGDGALLFAARHGRADQIRPANLIDVVNRNNCSAVEFPRCWICSPSPWTKNCAGRPRATKRPGAAPELSADRIRCNASTGYQVPSSFTQTDARSLSILWVRRSNPLKVCERHGVHRGIKAVKDNSCQYMPLGFFRQYQ